MKIRDIAKVCLAAMLYKAVITKNKVLADNTTRYYFEMRPRTIMVVLFHLVTSPLFILMIGIKGLLASFQHTNKVQNWSSYQIVTNGVKPTRTSMYKKF